MNKYTIFDYDEYLKMESGLSPFQIPLWNTKRIDESKGIVDEYIPIVDELYEALMNEKPIPFNNDISYLQYALLNYKFKQEQLFMKNCSIVLLTGIVGDSSFCGNEAAILNDSKKMIGAKFIIRIKDKFIDSENGKNEFYQTMAHEIQHVYRFYNIFLSNNSYYDEEMKRMERGKNAYKISRNTSLPLEYVVATVYYLSDRNEISSESNRLYEFLRNNTQINEDNINEFLNNELPLYTISENLKNFLIEMDSNIKIDNTSYIRQIGEIFKKIIKDSKTTPLKSFLKFRTRVIDSAMFANRLFKRTIAKAFDDFNRRTNNPNATELANEMKETMNDFKLIKEILKKY